MQGRSPEFTPIQKETVDAGFSEKKSARIREGALADNSQVSTNTNQGSPATKKRKLSSQIRRMTDRLRLLSKRHRI